MFKCTKYKCTLKNHLWSKLLKSFLNNSKQYFCIQFHMSFKKDLTNSYTYDVSAMTYYFSYDLLLPVLINVWILNSICVSTFSTVLQLLVLNFHKINWQIFKEKQLINEHTQLNESLTIYKSEQQLWYRLNIEMSFLSSLETVYDSLTVCDNH